MGTIHGLAIKTDGTLWSWGNNGSGRLGTNSTTTISSPVQVGALTNWKKVMAGLGTSHAIKTDGTLWGWGANTTAGQVGDNTIVSKSSPTQIGTLTNWVDVTSGGNYTGQLAHVLARKNDGGLWSWGNNGYGQLGSDSVVARSSPAQVGALTDWKQLVVGHRQSLAVKTDGTLWSWGQNSVGELGQNDTAHRSSPTQVGNLTNWAYVDAGLGTTSSVGLKTDGTIWAWGGNAFGQHGQSDTIIRSSPVQIGALTTWQQIVMAEQTVLAVKTDGTLWAWGRGSYGTIGIEDAVNRSSPVQVSTAPNWRQILAGGSTASALRFPPTWTDPLFDLEDIAVVDDGDSPSPSSGGGTSTQTHNSESSSGPDTVLLVTWYAVANSDITLNSVTWSGSSVTILTQQHQGSAGGSTGVAICYISGSQSGNVVLSLSAAPDNTRLTILSLTNLVSATPADTDGTTSSSASALSLTALASPGTGGVRIAGLTTEQGGSYSCTWTNATEVTDLTAGGHGWSAAYDLGDDATTITGTWSLGPAPNSIAGVSLR
jgi:hypothetical protein